MKMKTGCERCRKIRKLVIWAIIMFVFYMIYYDG